MKLMKIIIMCSIICGSNTHMFGMWSTIRNYATKATTYAKNQGQKIAYTANQTIKRNAPLIGGTIGATLFFAGMTNRQTVYAQALKQQTMPPASLWKYTQPSKKDDLIKQFTQDCNELREENQAIPSHTPNKETVRIASYNVHFWTDAKSNRNFDNIAQTIREINADILVLQEVSLFDQARIEQTFHALGYTCIIFAKAQYYDYHKPFGNMVLSKYPLTQPHEIKTYNADQKYAGERRNYIKVDVMLPNDKKASIYGTHLDAHDPTETLRAQEVEELIATTHTKNEPCLIAGDFNAVRQSDYQYMINDKKVWDVLSQADKKRAGIATPTKALHLLESNGFTDSFTRSNHTCPKFTVWSGTTVDFMWLNKQWNLPIAGSYVYYSTASDHLPIITDVKVS